MTGKKNYVLLIALFCLVFNVAAETAGTMNDTSGGVSGLWQDFKDNVSQTWNEPQYTDIYLPFLSWHNRYMYDKHKTDNYNEMPWGGGIGVSRYTPEGNWSGLFAMVFQDSHREWQPAAGYGWEKGWYLTQSKDLRLGLGLAGGITARDDFANYVPLPFVFPLFSAGYKNINLQFTYIPGTYNNGNVLFAWLRAGF
ncbi:lipid IV(A) palmitoyltransferase PagP [Rahnella victoriana]|jgi:palmitoyl transferase|uniref:Lipid A acyltransferase PagP n=2 Tax=Rahnella victoriana TaxID=1510570 RepID=A0ABS0DUS2_9GAMM|nr:lipid IV(A) palmitoyltransferase PagP [Rahnella victoriana]MBF7957635.1 lipid IV(A) palmitoyltransferase PagP [Rahnella victoriana]TBX36057.1 phospholipid:lipid A palmitoyltransferase [Rahnella victoriana]UHM93263.1 lipid IV(A) palmitoyltransferase PagP [Rahnella victoriana]